MLKKVLQTWDESQKEKKQRERIAGELYNEKTRRSMYNVLKNTRDDPRQGRVRNFFKMIKHCKPFNSKNKAIKNQSRQILIDSENKK